MSKLRCLNGTMGGTLHDRLQLGMSVAHPFSASEILEIPIYLEGGNVLSLTNVEGRKKVLIGQIIFRKFIASCACQNTLMARNYRMSIYLTVK